MRIVATISETRKAVRAARAEGKTIGLVPTMGALHAAHLALMSRAREECGSVVVSVFVNPTQFGPTDNFEQYPRDLESDAAKAASAGVDLIFAPSAAEIYPAGFDAWVEVGGLTGILEGASRPGHFRGVTTVVAKLFNIVGPDRAYFGMKDYQQLKAIQKMVRDLDFPIEIVPVPTVREPDGLAMSSRNAYLSTEERTAATVLHRALKVAEELVNAGERDPEKVREAALGLIRSEPLADVDYVALVDPETLQAQRRVERPALVALAVRVGQTRLIDNMLIEFPR
ncbi:MAG: pantoate--beta-alanine ligase [Armatimonadota bacterium]|nr:pantoate--beta-alanine ligase [Armatimonadota bacterium]